MQGMDAPYTRIMYFLCGQDPGTNESTTDDDLLPTEVRYGADCWATSKITRDISTQHNQHTADTITTDTTSTKVVSRGTYLHGRPISRGSPTRVSTLGLRKIWLGSCSCMHASRRSYSRCIVGLPSQRGQEFPHHGRVSTGNPLRHGAQLFARRGSNAVLCVGQLRSSTMAVTWTLVA